jgi:hypothetical protein
MERLSHKNNARNESLLQVLSQGILNLRIALSSKQLPQSLQTVFMPSKSKQQIQTLE